MLQQRPVCVCSACYLSLATTTAFVFAPAAIALAAAAAAAAAAAVAAATAYIKLSVSAGGWPPGTTWIMVDVHNVLWGRPSCPLREKKGKVRKKQAPQCFTGFKACVSTQLTDGLRWTLDHCYHCCIDD
jgi:hypothetical protein